MPFRAMRPDSSAAIADCHAPGVREEVIHPRNALLQLVGPLDAKALHVRLELLDARRPDDCGCHKRPRFAKGNGEGGGGSGSG